MKKIDISKTVMDRVSSFEKKRSTWWIVKFIFVLSMIMSAIIILVSATTSVLSHRRTWDLLQLFEEDPEIISEYWLDTFLIFWEELPKEEILVTALLIMLVLGIYIITKHRRKIIQNRLRQLAKHR